MSDMKFDQFRKLAQRMYGKQWKPNIMIRCDVTERTISRWQANGEVPLLAAEWITAEAKK